MFLQVKVLKCMEPIKLSDTVLGQYGGNPEMEGDAKFSYVDDPTVPKGSVTPTFATCVTYIRNERWDGEFCRQLSCCCSCYPCRITN